jgi:hypothetical protein
LFPESKSATSRFTASINRKGIFEKHTGLPTSLQLLYPPTDVIQKETQLHQIVQYCFVIQTNVWEEHAASVLRIEATLKLEAARCSVTWYPTSVLHSEYSSP